MDKEDVVHINTGLLLSPLTWMQLGIIILSEVNQKEKQITCDITYVWNIKYDTNELIYETETDSLTRRTVLWLPRGRGLGEGWSAKLGLANVSYYTWRG